jgi:hypothetical protein
VNFRLLASSWLARSPWVLLSVPVLGLVELGAHVYFRQRTPELSEYSALKPEVEKLKGPGDLVAVSPYWAEPNLRWALGDQLLPLADVARPEDSRYRAVVEVLLPGHSSQFSEWELAQTKTVGKFRLERRTNPDPEVVVYDFLQHLNPEEVQVELHAGAELRQACTYNPNARVTNGALGGHPTYPKQRFQCGKDEWDFVGITVIEDQNYRPRQCMWAHPPPGQLTKVIRFPKVKLGTRITGHLGIPYLVDREQKGKPVNVRVSVAGQEVGQVSHNQGEGWHSFNLDTTKYAGSEQAVEFRIDAKSVKYRTLCFQADVR